MCGCDGTWPSSAYPPPCRSRSTGPPDSWGHPAQIAGLPARRPARTGLCAGRDDPSPAAARTGPPRKALKDAATLNDVLETHGAELVLHGHNHEHMLNVVNSRWGAVNVLGVPSASMIESVHHPLAAWNLYRIQRTAENGPLASPRAASTCASGPIQRLTNSRFQHDRG